MGYAIIVAALVALDQLSKLLVRALLPLGQAKTVLPGVLALRHVENTGVAFSMLSGAQWAVAAVTACLMAGIVWWLARHKEASRTARFSLLLILAGGIGNLIDRVLFQSVTDFFEVLFVRFAVFNAADCFITCGAILLAIRLLLDGRKKEEKTDG